MLCPTLSPATAARPQGPAAPPAGVVLRTFLPPTAVPSPRHHRRHTLLRSATIAQAAPATFNDTTRSPPPPLGFTNPNHLLTDTISPAAAAPTAPSPDPEARCAGAMLGAMCGNVLGAPLQHEQHWMVTRRFPNGVKDFWRFDFTQQPASYGHYTGDYSLLLASAQSLASARACDSQHLASFLTQMDLMEEGQPQQAEQQPQAEQQQQQAEQQQQQAEQQQAGQQQQAEGQQQQQQQTEGQQPGMSVRQQLMDVFVSQEGRRPRSLPPYAKIMLSALEASKMSLSSLPHLALKLLDVSTPRNSQISGDRFDREPYGPSDNGAAARILPVALAYRDAPPEVLEAAVQEACLFSHPHPVGLDGARVAAAAVVWLSKHDAWGLRASSSSGGGGGSGNGQGVAPGPQQLLRHLQSVARTEDMQQKLALLQEQVFQVKRVASWRQFYRSTEWTRLSGAMSRLTFHGNATAGTEAVAVALLAMLSSWQEPEQALVLAASFGGSAPVTSQITGALVGALHGDAWIPARWWEALENGPEGGRDRVAALGRELAALRCGAAGGAAAAAAPPAGSSENLQ